MTRIISIGMNHETSSVKLRECLSSEPDNSLKALEAMKCMDCIKESFFLSTCNRVEALFVTDEADIAKEKIVDLMCRLGRLTRERLIESLYILEGNEAIQHVYRVACSLDSMVLGEPQILGQLKNAYSEAVSNNAAGTILYRLMHRAFHVAKKVRTETGICESAVSISYAAVELAKKIFRELEGKKALLIGAGEMARLAAQHFVAQGVSSVTVANRTFERAVEVAKEFNAHAVTFDDIDDQLVQVDIVVSSTAATDYVITYDQVRNCQKKRRNRPLFFIDIAVPRDIQPEINKLDNVYVYDIDDLNGIVRLNMAQRQEEAKKAEQIVKDEVLKFEAWMNTLAVVPTIVSLREKADSIIQSEIKKSYPSLSSLSSGQMDAIKILTRSIAEKILNDPILFLKRKANDQGLDSSIDMTRRLFNLDIEDSE